MEESALGAMDVGNGDIVFEATGPVVMMDFAEGVKQLLAEA